MSGGGPLRFNKGGSDAVLGICRYSDWRVVGDGVGEFTESNQ